MEAKWNFVKQNDNLEIRRLPSGNVDPVFKNTDTNTYGFFDETWADACGPFLTREEASDACKKYAECL